MLKQERRPAMSTRLRASGLFAALVAVGVLMALVSALLVGDARSASQGSGLIAFTRDDGVYVVGVDGTGLQRLWQGKRMPTEVTWSPDGRKLAFSTRRAGIWVMNADGSNPVPVAGVRAGSLTWSADGRRIAFTSRDDIWLMNADGSNIRLLRRTPRLSEDNVDWKPTGGWVAFDGPGGYVRWVYVMRTNGRNLRNLTSSRPWGIWSRQPDWSPDGRRIVVASDPSNTNSDIWVTNAGGKQRVRLTKNRAQDSSPVWSPDGRRIAFLRGDWAKDRSWEIYVMNADGTGVTRLTHNRVAEGNPAWQPATLP
jgi:TolB protein